MTVCKGERNSRRGEAQHGDEGSQLAGEVKDQDEGDRHQHHDVPRAHQQALAIRIRHVASHRHSPEQRSDQDDQEGDSDP